jgi:hypothetical protein
MLFSTFVLSMRSNAEAVLCSFLAGLFHNPVTLFGVTVSLCVILGVVYIHGLHRIFNTQDLTGIGTCLALQSSNYHNLLANSFTRTCTVYNATAGLASCVASTS